MARNTGTIDAADEVVVLSQDAQARFAVFQLTGTYANAVYKFEGSNDGTTYFPVLALLMTDYSTKTGNIGPADNAALGYLVFAPGCVQVRVKLVSISTGGVAVDASSDTVSDRVLTLPPTASAVAYAVASGDGAITLKDGTVFVTKATAAALTLAAPSAGTDDGKRLAIITTTAAAHTVTQTAPGYNNGGAASDVATFTAAIGNSMVVAAYNGVWYTESLRNVTLA
jgi:hypothetical protein